MSVHPRSLYAARFEYERSNGGQKWPLNDATLAEIIAEVHAVAKKHQRSREIRLRMKSMAWKHESVLAHPAPAEET